MGAPIGTSGARGADGGTLARGTASGIAEDAGGRGAGLGGAPAFEAAGEGAGAGGLTAWPCGTGAGAGDCGVIPTPDAGVGRRPGTKGGTRVGVALRGTLAGGVNVPPAAADDAPVADRAMSTRSVTAAAAPDAGRPPGRADDVRLAAS